MLLKSEFFHMCNQLGFEDSELSLAEIVWDRAERAMQGKPLQQAKLLKSEVLTRSNKPVPVLTQPELQMLTSTLALTLFDNEESLKGLKKLIDACWNESIPENENTRKCFDEMNEYRNLQRKIKKTNKALARIQYKLKKMKGR